VKNTGRGLNHTDHGMTMKETQRFIGGIVEGSLIFGIIPGRKDMIIVYQERYSPENDCQLISA